MSRSIALTLPANFDHYDAMKTYLTNPNTHPHPFRGLPESLQVGTLGFVYTGNQVFLYISDTLYPNSPSVIWSGNQKVTIINSPIVSTIRYTDFSAYLAYYLGIQLRVSRKTGEWRLYLMTGGDPIKLQPGESCTVDEGDAHDYWRTVSNRDEIRHRAVRNDADKIRRLVIDKLLVMSKGRKFIRVFDRDDMKPLQLGMTVKQIELKAELAHTVVLKYAVQFYFDWDDIFAFPLKPGHSLTIEDARYALWAHCREYFISMINDNIITISLARVFGSAMYVEMQEIRKFLSELDSIYFPVSDIHSGRFSYWYSTDILKLPTHDRLVAAGFAVDE